MTNKLRIIQSDREEIVIKIATEEFIAQARQVMSDATGALTVEKKGRVFHLAARHIVRLEVELGDDQDDDQG